MTAPATVPGIKATPILFSAPMIRALLEGRKTQTRRPVKGTALDWLDAAGFDPAFVAASENGLCPYGSPGDLLWCRETWQLHTRAIDTGKVVYRASENASHTEFHRLVPVGLMGNTQPKPFQEGWRLSIHMPRWASRLTLELTGVRVERLQDISEADAVAEGADHNGSCDHKRQSCEGIGCFGPDSFRGGFCELWESLHGEGSWDANPWVWVIQFQAHQQNIDALLERRRAA